MSVSASQVAKLAVATAVVCVSVKVGKNLNYKRQVRIDRGKHAADVLRCMADLDACETIIISARQCSK